MTAPAQRITPATDREYGLDWLRVFAFSVLIFYHSGMAFVSWDWHLKNAEQSRNLEYLMLLCNRWRLPLLFRSTPPVPGLRNGAPGRFRGGRGADACKHPIRPRSFRKVLKS